MNSLFRKTAVGAVFAIAALAATPASATTEVPVTGTLTGCATGPIAPPADKCAGYFSGNDFSNLSSDVSMQQSAINALLGNTSYTVDFNALKDAGLVVSGSDLNALNNLLAGAGGQVLLGLHWGNVPGAAGNVSAFYLWNNATPGSIHLTDTQGYSNAVLYRATAAVPEPATWALMLLGFGGMGVSMRRRRLVSALPQMA
ncbi:PEPxxWA-CTERM sorting domain-containing protein [Sphingomonas sp. KRR8]|uniref:PEPxxWA-CTERM sorting domain-containing protein n=1 Tax=Sphingomonas sp. KRR8 TaxID=2942996 RepID=UPI00201FEF62|nr:PEPxxWA-CTERM sorting domain-containing protein [Sphingomonas sp. KRR8]URD61539.1 PEPxxWA-CTERM sorting domain-containing protein [Sphingomonas sp. KRR8]